MSLGKLSTRREYFQELVYRRLKNPDDPIFTEGIDDDFLSKIILPTLGDLCEIANEQKGERKNRQGTFFLSGKDDIGFISDVLTSEDLAPVVQSSEFTLDFKNLDALNRSQALWGKLYIEAVKKLPYSREGGLISFIALEQEYPFLYSLHQRVKNYRYIALAEKFTGGLGSELAPSARVYGYFYDMAGELDSEDFYESETTYWNLFQFAFEMWNRCEGLRVQRSRLSSVSIQTPVQTLPPSPDLPALLAPPPEALLTPPKSSQKRKTLMPEKKEAPPATLPGVPGPMASPYPIFVAPLDIPERESIPEAYSQLFRTRELWPKESAGAPSALSAFGTPPLSSSKRHRLLEITQEPVSAFAPLVPPTPLFAPSVQLQPTLGEQPQLLVEQLQPPVEQPQPTFTPPLLPEILPPTEILPPFAPPAPPTEILAPAIDELLKNMILTPPKVQALHYWNLNQQLNDKQTYSGVPDVYSKPQLFRQKIGRALFNDFQATKLPKAYRLVSEAGFSNPAWKSMLEKEPEVEFWKEMKTPAFSVAFVDLSDAKELKAFRAFANTKLKKNWASYCLKHLQPRYYKPGSMCGDFQKQTISLEDEREGVSWDFYSKALRQDNSSRFAMILYFNTDGSALDYPQLADKNLVVGFLYGEILSETEAELISFCVDYSIFDVLAAPTPRASIVLYNAFEEEMKRRGIKVISLEAVTISERFWYARGYRYSRCSVVDEYAEQAFCARKAFSPEEADARVKMYKCI